MKRAADTGEAVEAALHALLRRCPTARIAALSGDSTVEAVDLPPSLPLGPGHRFMGTGRLHDEFTIPDSAVLSKLWGRARSVGAAVAPVTLRVGEERVLVFFFNVVRTHGVMIVVVTDTDDAMEAEELRHLGDFRTPSPEQVVAARVGRAWKDGSAVLRSVDDGFARLLGWSQGEVTGRRSLEFIHPEDQETAIDNWLQMLDLPGPGRPVRLRHRHRDGRWVWVEMTNHNRLADPAHGDVMAEVVDISEEVAATEAALARQQLLEQLTEALPLGLFHAGVNGQVLYANQQLSDVAGLCAGDSILAWPRLVPSFAASVNDTITSALAGLPGKASVEIRDPKKGVRQLSVAVRPLSDATGGVVGITGSIEDVTEAVEERKQLEVRAATDAFTECLNRAATLSCLQRELDSIRPGGRGVAVVFLDLDGLKKLNDRLGHLAGDALLLEVASRLKRGIRGGDIVGRFGGDEFVVVATSIAGPKQALEVARKIAARTLGKIEIEGETVETRASIGVAWTDRRGTEASWLVRQADSAMYRSKREGRCHPVLA